MRVLGILVLAGSSIFAGDQIFTGNMGPVPNAPLFTTSTVFREPVDASSPTAQFTSGGGGGNATDTSTPNGNALSWTAGGLTYSQFGHGGMFAPWPIGTQDFDFKIDHAYTTCSGSNCNEFKDSTGTCGIPCIGGNFGAMWMISSDRPGQFTSNTISVVGFLTTGGWNINIRQGIPYWIRGNAAANCVGGVLAWGTGPSINGVSGNGNAGKFSASMVGTTLFMYGQSGTYTNSVITGFVDTTHVNISPVPTSCNAFSSDWELSDLNQHASGRVDQVNNGTWTLVNAVADTIPYQLGMPQTQTFQIQRVGNTITWHAYDPTYKGGIVPFGEVTNNSFYFVGNSYTLTGGAEAVSLQYVVLANGNGLLNPLSPGWGCEANPNGNSCGTVPFGLTSDVGNTTAAPFGADTQTTYIMRGKLSNIRAHGPTTGTPPIISSVTPASTSIVTAATVDVFGTNLNSGSTVKVGSGAAAQTAATTFISPSHLTFVAPTESNSATPYPFQLLDPSGYVADYPGGILYNTLLISRADPHEASPAGGDVITLTGSGFGSGSTVTVGGSAATSVTIIDGQHLTFTAPVNSLGSTASNVSQVCVTSGTTVCTDTTTFLFGFAAHPYMHFTATELTALQSKFNTAATGGAFADYAQPIIRDVTTIPYTHTTEGGYNGKNFPYGNRNNEGNRWNAYQSYGIWKILSGSTAHDSDLFNGTSNLAFNNALNEEMASISFAPFDTELRGMWDANIYDALFPILTTAQRTGMLNTIDRWNTYCRQLSAAGDSNLFPSGLTTNIISITNASCVQLGLATNYSRYEFAKNTTANSNNPWLKRFVTNMKSYASQDFSLDGLNTEVSAQYWAFGTTPYVATGRALTKVFGDDQGGSGAPGLLEMPFYALNPKQLDLEWGAVGNLLTPGDSQPQHYDVAIISEMGERFSKPNMLNVADYESHAIAIGDPFGAGTSTSFLDAQASRFDYSYWAFLWRTGATTPTFTGWPTTLSGGYDNASPPFHAYRGVIRSSSAFTPTSLISLKSQNAIAAKNFHGAGHCDSGSVVFQSRAQDFLIDPGYNADCGGGNNQTQVNAPLHSTVTVEGVRVPKLSTIGPSGLTSVLNSWVDDTVTIDRAGPPTVRSMTMELTPTFGRVSISSLTITGAAGCTTAGITCMSVPATGVFVSGVTTATFTVIAPVSNSCLIAALNGTSQTITVTGATSITVPVDTTACTGLGITISTNPANFISVDNVSHRRIVTMYNGAMVVMDDLNTKGNGVVSAFWQGGYQTTIDSASTFTVHGPTSNLACKLNGPTPSAFTSGAPQTFTSVSKAAASVVALGNNNNPSSTSVQYVYGTHNQTGQFVRIDGSNAGWTGTGIYGFQPITSLATGGSGTFGTYMSSFSVPVDTTAATGTFTGTMAFSSDFGFSWVFQNLGTSWWPVKATYTAPTGGTAPMVTACIDSASGLTQTGFTNSAGTITVNFSDGGSLVYLQAGSPAKWTLQ